MLAVHKNKMPPRKTKNSKRANTTNGTQLITKNSENIQVPTHSTPSKEQVEQNFSKLRQISRQRSYGNGIFKTNKEAKRFQPEIFKWKINFDGSGKILDFLDKIEDKIYSRGISENELIQGFSDLVEGPALRWFRTVREHVTNWETLKAALIHKYEPLNYQTRLENDLRNTRQLNGENMNDFITRLDSINARLTPRLNDNTMLEIIKMNVLPLYHTLLGTSRLTDISNLLDLAKNFEQYCTESSLFASTSGAQKPAKKLAAMEEAVKLEEIQQGKFKQPYRGNSLQHVSHNQNLKCLKCDRLGHNYRECKIYPHTICFRCKNANTLTANCSNCTRNQSSRQTSYSKNVSTLDRN